MDIAANLFDIFGNRFDFERLMKSPRCARNAFGVQLLSSFYQYWACLSHGKHVGASTLERK